MFFEQFVINPNTPIKKVKKPLCCPCCGEKADSDDKMCRRCIEEYADSCVPQLQIVEEPIKEK